MASHARLILAISSSLSASSSGRITESAPFDQTTAAVLCACATMISSRRRCAAAKTSLLAIKSRSIAAAVLAYSPAFGAAEVPGRAASMSVSR